MGFAAREGFAALWANHARRCAAHFDAVLLWRVVLLTHAAARLTPLVPVLFAPAIGELPGAVLGLPTALDDAQAGCASNHGVPSPATARRAPARCCAARSSRRLPA